MTMQMLTYNVGKRIWGTQRKVMLRTAFMQATKFVPGRGKA